MSNQKEHTDFESHPADPLQTFARVESQIAFDFKNQLFISLSPNQSGDNSMTYFKATENESLQQTEQKKILDFDDRARREKTIDLLTLDDAENKSYNDALERSKKLMARKVEAEKKKQFPLNYFADTWNILRFIKGNKSRGV
jgi:hypothetical protein